MDVSKITHHAEAVVKCPSIRLGVSDECFTYALRDSHLLELTMEKGLDVVKQMHESSVKARMGTATFGHLRKVK